jgi:hypothetical protein
MHVPITTKNIAMAMCTPHTEASRSLAPSVTITFKTNERYVGSSLEATRSSPMFVAGLGVGLAVVYLTQVHRDVVVGVTLA